MQIKGRSKYKNRPKPKKKFKKRNMFEVLEMAQKLQKKPPRSEKWFQNLFKDHKNHTDNYNEYFLGLIPDLVNHCYKYIIEIDGNIHNLDDIKSHDRYKENKYIKSGYHVIRIIAYDLNSFNKALQRRNTIIHNYNIKMRHLTHIEKNVNK